MVTERLIVRQKKMSGCTAVVTFHQNVNPLLKKSRKQTRNEIKEQRRTKKDNADKHRITCLQSFTFFRKVNPDQFWGLFS